MFMYICNQWKYVVKIVTNLLQTVNSMESLRVKRAWDTSDFLYFIQSLAYNLCTQNVIDNRNVVSGYQGVIQ